MQSKPSVFVNIFSFDGKLMPLENNGVATSLEEAVKDARDFQDAYSFTLTDVGRVDLSPHFSEGFQQKRDFDAAVDRKIDQMKEDAREVA